jgi:hypothetical protein
MAVLVVDVKFVITCGRKLVVPEDMTMLHVAADVTMKIMHSENMFK